MKEKARELLNKIQDMCVRYYYMKENIVLEESRDLIKDIRDFCSVFFKGNIFGMEEEEYQGLQAYVVQVLEDYMEALQNKDTVWLIDTLDCGLRELLMIFISEEDIEE